MHSFLLKHLLEVTSFQYFGMRLELLGFHVMAVVCDGASQNRRFFTLHGKKETYKVNNPYAIDDRLIFSYLMCLTY